MASARAEDIESTFERRETSGVTTRLILSYVERERGRGGVDELLRIAGLEGREERLRNENQWFSWEAKIALLDAAAEVLGDPQAGRRIGAAGLDFNLAQGVKLSLRALGTPRLLYRNIVRASSKFTLCHRMEADEVGPRNARIRYVDISGRGYEQQDCELNIGYLSSAPALFGLPPARVSHPICARDGGDTCVYDVRWEGGASRARRWMATVAAAAGLAAATFAVEPGLEPVAAGIGAAAIMQAGFSEARWRRRRYELVLRKAEHNADGAQRLEGSLRDLVSDLRTDEVLEKITRNAQAAVGGKEFALLVADGGGMFCRSSSVLPPQSVAALERWASKREDLTRAATQLDDLASMPDLAVLAADRDVPLRSLCAAPLISRGECIGVLVALANGADGFLPNDVTLLESYAVQAAIALANAQMFEDQQELASRDALTELQNHREFHEQVARELERCRRHGGALTVVMFDLDGFKLVNDTRGHAAGDELLRKVAAALSESTRSSDVAFRLGGDEFALLLPSTSGPEALEAAERARAAMAAVDSKVGVSFGLGEWPYAGPSKDSLIACADANLYAMKREGGSGTGTGVRAGTDDRESAARLDAQRQRGRLAAARRLSAQLAPLRDPVSVARATVDELAASFDWFLVVLDRLDPHDDTLRPLAAAGELVELMGGIDWWTQTAAVGVKGRAARTGEPVVVPDTARDPDFMAPEGVPLKSRSELALPIRVGGEIWGVLNLESSQPDAFSPDDLVFADLLAGHVGAALDRCRLLDELEGTFTTTLAVLSDALERKDAYTAAHADEVADLTVRVGARLGIEGDALRTLKYAGLLHDIGKIGIRSEILQKPSRLTEEEFEEIKEHTNIGADMLARIPYFEGVVPLVRYAHERWDGRGYPAGLAGEAIPLGARVICACDAFNAMITERPYKAAMPIDEAIAELRRNAGTQFDAVVVDVLIADIEGALGAYEEFASAEHAGPATTTRSGP